MFRFQGTYILRNFSLSDKFVFYPFSATYKTEIRCLGKLSGGKPNVWGATLKFMGEYRNEPRSAWI